MYSWDMTRKIRKVNKNKIVLDPDMIELVIDETIKVKNMKTAIKSLKEQNIIPSNIKDDIYRNYLLKSNRYRQWKKEQKLEQDKLYQKAKDLKAQGMSNKNIGELLGISTSSAFYITHGVVKKTSNKKNIGRSQAQKLVDYWNNYSYEGQIMTLETKQAFELLGLEVPCKH